MVVVTNWDETMWLASQLLYTSLSANWLSEFCRFADRASQYLTNLMYKICFTISFISCLYMFRAHVLIIRRSKLYYTASGIITPIGVMQFWPPDDEHMCSKHVEAWNKLIVKQILCIKLVKYWHKWLSEVNVYFCACNLYICMSKWMFCMENWYRFWFSQQFYQSQSITNMDHLLFDMCIALFIRI